MLHKLKYFWTIDPQEEEEEDVEEEKENEVETILNDEECQDTTAESEEAAESELLEKVDTSVGLQDNEESDLVKEEPNYVQMSLDGIHHQFCLMPCVNDCSIYPFGIHQFGTPE